MVFFGTGDIKIMRHPGVATYPKVNSFFVNRYLGCVPPSSFVKGHSLITRFSMAICSAVGSVLPVRRLPQVGNSVVVFNAVDVVDLTPWPFASHIEPCKAVGAVGFPPDHNLNIPLVVGGPGRSLSFCLPAVLMVLFPSKNPSIRAIVKDVSNVASRYWLSILLTHKQSAAGIRAEFSYGSLPHMGGICAKLLGALQTRENKHA